MRRSASTCSAKRAQAIPCQGIPHLSPPQSLSHTSYIPCRRALSAPGGCCCQLGSHRLPLGSKLLRRTSTPPAACPICWPCLHGTPGVRLERHRLSAVGVQLLLRLRVLNLQLLVVHLQAGVGGLLLASRRAARRHSSGATLRWGGCRAAARLKVHLQPLPSSLLACCSDPPMSRLAANDCSSLAS